MTIKIVTFGKIADVLSCSEWELSDVETVGELRQRLEKDFPALGGLRYRIAVDKKMANDDERLREMAEVALLPPFSGG